MWCFSPVQRTEESHSCRRAVKLEYFDSHFQKTAVLFDRVKKSFLYSEKKCQNMKCLLLKWHIFFCCLKENMRRNTTYKCWIIMGFFHKFSLFLKNEFNGDGVQLGLFCLVWIALMWMCCVAFFWYCCGATPDRRKAGNNCLKAFHSLLLFLFWGFFWANCYVASVENLVR